MILQVIKENEHFPVGTLFKYSNDANAFICVVESDDVGEGYEFRHESYYLFSPLFYEQNKEIFNQVKLEEKDEKNKNTEGEETPPQESQSKDICAPEYCDRGCPVCSPRMREDIQREEMEEGRSQSESSGSSVLEEGSEEADQSKNNSEEDKRVADFNQLDRAIFDAMGTITNWRVAVENSIFALRDAYEQFRENLK